MKWLIVILAVLLSCTAVAAVEFTVDITPVKEKILENETAIYDVLVTNRHIGEVRFEVSSPSVIDGTWSVLTDPLTATHFTLEPGKSAGFKVYVRYTGSEAAYGLHQVLLDVSGDLTKIKERLNVNILNPLGSRAQYFPRIALTPFPEYDKTLDPSAPLDVRVHLLNKNSLDLTDLVVKISTPFLSSEKRVHIGPYEARFIDFNIPVDPFVPPQDSVMSVKLLVDDKVVTSEEYGLRVEFTQRDVEKSEVVDARFLMTTTNVRLYNPSNKALPYTFSYPASFVERLLLSITPDATYSDGQYHVEVMIPPDGAVPVVVTRSYRGVLWTLLILIALVFAYRAFRPVIAISKRASKVVRHSDDTLEGARIIVMVKNISNKPVTDVKIIEILPNILGHVPGSIVGSLEPTEVKVFRTAGTHLVWHVDELLPKEERIIIYNVKTKLKVRGKFELAPTIVKFTQGNKLKENFSPKLLLVNE